MSLVKIIYLIFAIVLSSALYASDNTSTDICKIAEYKGLKGEWIENNDPDKLEHFIKTYGSGFKQIIAINGKNYRKEEKVFVPYSDLYMVYLKAKETTASTSSENDFTWPIERFDRITSTFGRRWSAFHEGIDIPAGKGVPIVATCNGRVTVSKFMDNYGNTVVIEHRENLYTRYCHASQLLVKEGDIVKKGQIIAYVGSTGNSTGNHLHFEIRYNNDFPLNPLDFLPFNPNVKKTQYIRKLD